MKLQIKKLQMDKKTFQSWEKDDNRIMYLKEVSSDDFDISLLLEWDRKTRKILQKIEFGKRALGLTISPDKTEIAISYANKIYLYKVNI